MERATAFMWTIIAAGTALAMPDISFRKPEKPIPIEEAGNVPDASDSARAFITAHAELAQGRVARQGPATLPMRLTIKAPEGVLLNRPPTDFVAVFDRSGSMAGEDRIGFARQGLCEAAELLKPGDRLAIVTFSDNVSVARNLAAVTDSGQEIAALARQITADGQTFLSGALYLAAKILREQNVPGRGRQILLLSDGKANVGLEGDELARLGESLGQEGIIITAMGVGVDYDASTFIRLGEGSGGGYAYVTQGERIPAAIRGEMSRGDNRFIDNMRICLDLPPGVEFATAYKYQARGRGRRVEILAPTLSAGEEKSIMVDFTVNPNLFAAGKGDLQRIARIRIEFDRPASTEEGTSVVRREVLTMSLGILLTSDGRLAEASQKIDIMAEREALRADLAWAATSPDVVAGRYDDAAAKLREEARTLQEKNRIYNSPSVASRITAMLQTALEIETRNFFGGSAVGVGTMGQNQAALSGGIY